MVTARVLPRVWLPHAVNGRGPRREQPHPDQDESLAQGFSDRPWAAEQRGRTGSRLWTGRRKTLRRSITREELGGGGGSPPVLSGDGANWKSRRARASAWHHAGHVKGPLRPVQARWIPWPPRPPRTEPSAGGPGLTCLAPLPPDLVRSFARSKRRGDRVTRCFPLSTRPVLVVSLACRSSDSQRHFAPTRFW